MNGTFNQSTVVKEYYFKKPLIDKIDSTFDNCIGVCYHKYFHTKNHICVYDNKLTKFGNEELANLTISDKSMGLFDLN